MCLVLKYSFFFSVIMQKFYFALHKVFLFLKTITLQEIIKYLSIVPCEWKTYSLSTFDGTLRGTVSKPRLEQSMVSEVHVHGFGHSVSVVLSPEATWAIMGWPLILEKPFAISLVAAAVLVITTHAYVAANKKIFSCSVGVDGKNGPGHILQILTSEHRKRTARSSSDMILRPTTGHQ